MKTKKQTSLEVLLKHLAEAAQPLSVAKLYALSNLDRDDLAQVQAMWPAMPGDRRASVVRHLADIVETNFEVNFEPVFRMALADPEASVRQAALDGLAEEDDPTLIPTLVTLMQSDPAQDVRATAASSLGHLVYLGEIEEIPAARIAPALAALRAVIASDEALEIRRRAVEALSFSGEQDVPEIIRNAYASPDKAMRASAVFAMGSSADDQWIATIISELEAQSPAMRYEAARAAGELEARTAVPTLARLLDDPDAEAQMMAVWALGQIGGDRARKLLTGIAQGDDEALAEAATEALQELEGMHDARRDMPLFVFDPHADEEDE